MTCVFINVLQGVAISFCFTSSIHKTEEEKTPKKKHKQKKTNKKKLPEKGCTEVPLRRGGGGIVGQFLLDGVLEPYALC